MFSERTKKRFWSKVKTQGECLVWCGESDRFFYQTPAGNGCTRHPRHVLFELVKGERIGQRKFFLSCKNPDCIRPEHVILGTDLAEDFWAKVDKTKDCWVWTDKTIRFLRDGKNFRPARLVWEMLHGPIPKNYVVVPACRNKRCVRPDHLLCCCRKDFLKLFAAMGRPKSKGISIPLPKARRLRESEVREIYEMKRAGESQRKIADHLGVTEGAISRWCRKLGFKMRCSKITSRKVKAIKRHYEAGKLVAWIAKRVGLSQPTVYKVIRNGFLCGSD